jgi:hypothetical protein
MFRKIKRCRICNGNISNILDLGKQPPANSLNKKKKRELFVSLNLVICKKCRTSQIDTTIKKNFLFKNYFWVTATSKKAKEFAQKFCIAVQKKIKKKNFSVLEIASNDCTFLKPFKKIGCKVLGVDPAKNINNKVKNINTLTSFFDYDVSKKIKKKYQSFDLIFARNVIPHNDNVNSIIKGFSNLMVDDSLGAIEFHYAGKILEENHYDSIYHEHIYYFTIRTIEKILNKHFLHIFDCKKSPISGGSIIIYFKKKKLKKSQKLISLLKIEKSKKFNEIETWKNFGINCIKHSKNLQKKLNDIVKITSEKVVGYGASARSSTMLNYARINNKQISHILDKNSLKDNHYTAGSQIKIINFKKDKNNLKNYKYIFILAWNFKDEIVKELKKNGYKGKYLIPLPKIKIV